jgi:ParB family transcriptional regulator, chromosome partitioning protein
MSRKALGRGLNALFAQTHPLEQDMVYIDIDRIIPTNTQPRQVFRQDKLEELAESIKTNGIIQPIVVRRSGERFQIIAGERRWRAAQMSGQNRIPCIIKEVPEENILELSLIENIQREELTPIEEANAYRRLLESLNMTQEELAKRLGKDRSSITNALRLLKLPSQLQRMLEDGQLSMGHARALLAVESTEDQLSLADRIISKNFSVRETEKLVKNLQNKELSDSPSTSDSNQGNSETANIAAAESKLSKKLSAPVRIRFQKEGGSIEIRFSSTDDLTRLFDLLIQRPAL